MSRLALDRSPAEDQHRVFRLLVLYRWLSLASPLLFLVAAGTIGVSDWLALAIAAGPTLLITFWARQLNRVLRAHPWLLLVDMLIVTLLLALSGGWPSPYYLYALSPLMAAAFFFQLRGALVASTVLAPLYLTAVAVGWQLTGRPVEWTGLWVDLIGFYLISGAFGYAARLLDQLQQTSEELTSAHRELGVLHSVTVALHEAGDIAAVQEELLETVTNALGFRRALLGLVQEEQPVISGWVGRSRSGEVNLPPQPSHTVSVPLAAEGGLAARALMEGRVCRASDEPCTASGWLNERFGISDCLLIPLRWGIQPVGILLVDTGEQPLEETSLHSLEAIAQQTAMSIGMMRTRTRRARESAVQAERGRIALDIHDVVSQSLFGIVFTLDGSLKLLESNPEAVRPELEWALQTAENVRQEIRNTIHALWSEEMTPQSFEGELRRYLDDVLQARTLAVTFDIQGDFEPLSAAARRSLYRIAQECLTNIVHHAAATEARVCVDVEDERARLVVRDDGRGFEPDVALTREYGREHFGLRGMQERARWLGGACDIFSQPGAGSSVVVDIPARRPRGELDAPGKESARDG